MKQLYQHRKPQTVHDLIRDISGASFNDAGTPSPEVNLKLAKRASSVVKSGAGTPSLTNTTGRRRAASSMRMALKSVNEVFGSNQNKAKFCMPLGF